MICPKCGHDNPDDEMFCEECDFRMDQKYKKNFVEGQFIIYGSTLAVIFGISALFGIIFNLAPLGMIFGAIGIALSSYIMTSTRVQNIKYNVKSLLLIQTISLAVSSYSFIMGLMNTF